MSYKPFIYKLPHIDITDIFNKNDIALSKINIISNTVSDKITINLNTLNNKKLKEPPNNQKDEITSEKHEK